MFLIRITVFSISRTLALIWLSTLILIKTDNINHIHLITTLLSVSNSLYSWENLYLQDYNDVCTRWRGCSELPRMSHCHFAFSLTETTVTPGNYVAWIQCLNVRQLVWVHFPALHVSRRSLAEAQPPWRFKIVYYHVTGVTHDISHIT